MRSIADHLQQASVLMEKVADPTIQLYYSEREEILELIDVLLTVAYGNVATHGYKAMESLVNPPMTDPPVVTTVVLLN